MKTYDLLKLFIDGEVYYEDCCRVEVNEYTESMKWLVGAVEDVKPGKDIAYGEYLVTFKHITINGKEQEPDYKLHDDDGGQVLMYRIERELSLSDSEKTSLTGTLHAVYKTWRRYPGMNTGKSEIHNLYREDITNIINIHDRL